MQGRRVEQSTFPPDLEAGDYMLAKGDSGDWWFRDPNGSLGRLDQRWTFTVHEDGTLTVGAGASGKKSIQKDEPGGGHWLLEHGVWSAL